MLTKRIKFNKKKTLSSCHNREDKAKKYIQSFFNNNSLAETNTILKYIFHVASKSDELSATNLNLIQNNTTDLIKAIYTLNYSDYNSLT
jgi:hypothetical protein